MLLFGLSLFAVITVVLTVYLIQLTNNLKRLQETVAQAIANIDVLFKQRFDEVPQLVTVCKQYMTYESELLKQLTQMRSRYSQTQSLADKSELHHQLTELLGDLKAQAESYPQLRASEQFSHLQQRISDLEMEIADRREYYNHAVTRLNACLESFPDGMVAQLSGVKRQSHFAASQAEKHLPSLDGLG